MRIHFIAIGGSVMHNLALALQAQGHQVSGSDDEIYDPARTTLSEAGLLPEHEGWNADRITGELDAVVVGKHAKKDNPELLKAHELGLSVYSFPEFVRARSENKQRIVIAGSHGKTTITAMVIHVLRAANKKFNYLVGGKVEGFEHQVRLSEDAPMIILEGDEYLTSPEDDRPKFLVYEPHIVVISGIAWDHYNVFPTEAEYRGAFEKLVNSMPKAGTIIYNQEDKTVKEVVQAYGDKESYYLYPFKTPDYKIRDRRYEIKFKGDRVPMSVIGRHNMANIAAAYEVCQLVGVNAQEFLQHISSFKGAGGRLESWRDEADLVMYKDFAHSPSKVAATTNAVAELHKKDRVIACLELHTFSSLNKEFIGQYKKTLAPADVKIVYVNAHTLEMKGFPTLSEEEIREAFGDKKIIFVTRQEELENALQEAADGKGTPVYLMMSSGNFGGLDLNTIGK